MKQDDNYMGAVRTLCDSLRVPLERVDYEHQKSATEIRLRAGKPLCLMRRTHTMFIGKYGEVSDIAKEKVIVGSKDIQESFLSICGWSVHSHQRELIGGYIAVQGGHRAGIAGTAAAEGGNIQAIRDIMSINLRISREVWGAADVLMQKCFLDKQGGVLLVGAPASGKTTVLRDLARQLSSGSYGGYRKVCVVDESGEIGAASGGTAGHDLGACSDLLFGYPKAKGLEIAIRYFSPEILICDEICTDDEINAVISATNCGVAVVTSIHASSIDELKSKSFFKPLIKTGAFKNIVFLESADKPSCIKEIIDVSMNEGMAKIGCQ